MTCIIVVVVIIVINSRRLVLVLLLLGRLYEEKIDGFLCAVLRSEQVKSMLKVCHLCTPRRVHGINNNK